MKSVEGSGDNKGLGEKMDEDEKETIDDAIKDGQDWLSSNPEADAEEIKEKREGDYRRCHQGWAGLAVEQPGGRRGGDQGRQLPTIIADNAGYDSAEIVQNLRSTVSNGDTEAGLNMFTGKVGNMKELGITECLIVKEQALVSATEAAEMILRVD